MTIIDPTGLADVPPYKWQETAHFDNSGSLAITEGDLCCLVWDETTLSLKAKPADTDTDNAALCMLVALEDITITGGGLFVVSGYAEVNISTGSVAVGERVIATTTPGIADGSTTRDGAGVFIGDEIGTSNKAPCWLGTPSSIATPSATFDDLTVTDDLTVGDDIILANGSAISWTDLRLTRSTTSTIKVDDGAGGAAFLTVTGNIFSDSTIISGDGTAGEVAIGAVGPSGKPGMTLSADGGTNLYENADGELKTDDQFNAAAKILASTGSADGRVDIGAIGPSGKAAIGFSGDLGSMIYEDSDGVLKTEDNLHVVGTIRALRTGTETQFVDLVATGGEASIKAAVGIPLTMYTDGSERFRINATGGFTIAEANDFVLGTATGSKIGTATTQKIGFWNATPVVQPTNVANPAGGATIDAEARTAIDAILSRLETTGFFAA